MLLEAALPDIATEPNELIDDWISTLEIENSDPCSPAGSPMRTMRQSAVLWIFMRRNVKRQASVRRHSAISTSAADRVCVVASATPATFISKATTKMTLSTTLSDPAIERKISGLRLSPAARRIAAPKLYSIQGAMPQKYSCI